MEAKQLTLEQIVAARELYVICNESPTGLRYAKIYRNFRAGDVAGSLTRNGYARIYVRGQRVMVHRIVFLLANGFDPYPFEVDHIDRDRLNNDPANLRLATSSQNSINRTGKHHPKSAARALGASGVRWVKKHGSGWMGQFGYKSRKYHLPTKPTREEAYQSVLDLRRELGAPC